MIFVFVDFMDYDVFDWFGVVIFVCWKKLDIFVGNVGMFGVLVLFGYISFKDFEKVLLVNVMVNW